VHCYAFSKSFPIYASCLLTGIMLSSIFGPGRLAPVERLAAVPGRPVGVQSVGRRSRNLEEIALGRLEVRVFNNRGSDEDDQVGLLARFGIAAEGMSEQREVAENRNLGVAVADVILDEAAEDERIAAGNHHASLHLADVILVRLEGALHAKRLRHC